MAICSAVDGIGFPAFINLATNAELMVVMHEKLNAKSRNLKLHQRQRQLHI